MHNNGPRTKFCGTLQVSIIVLGDFSFKYNIIDFYRPNF